MANSSVGLLLREESVVNNFRKSVVVLNDRNERVHHVNVRSFVTEHKDIVRRYFEQFVTDLNTMIVGIIYRRFRLLCEVRSK